MNNKSIGYKILHFPLTKILTGFIVILLSTGLITAGLSLMMKAVSGSSELQQIIPSLISPFASLFSYLFLFRYYEKREISELSLKDFPKFILIGFFTGLILQSLTILVIYLNGAYTITKTNSFLFLVPGFVIALSSAITEEILFRGILFRITEEKLGSVYALIISSAFFGGVHLLNDNSTLFSAFSIAAQAGVLLGASYMYTRNLWLPIFLHFAWNFAEAGIFGAKLSGNEVQKSLFSAEFSGNELISGGTFGPENSIQATIFCLIAATIFLILAKRKKNFVLPFWKGRN